MNTPSPRHAALFRPSCCRFPASHRRYSVSEHASVRGHIGSRRQSRWAHNLRAIERKPNAYRFGSTAPGSLSLIHHNIVKLKSARIPEGNTTALRSNSSSV